MILQGDGQRWASIEAPLKKAQSGMSKPMASNRSKRAGIEAPFKKISRRLQVKAEAISKVSMPSNFSQREDTSLEAQSAQSAPWAHSAPSAQSSPSAESAPSPPSAQ